MGFLSAIVRSLGLGPPLAPREPEPLVLTDAARVRLAGLPAGHVANVSTANGKDGRFVVVLEGAPRWPLAADLPGVAIRDEERARLRGLRLDHDGKRWAVRLAMRIEPSDTPNPDSRFYATDRFLARGRPRYFTRDQSGPPLAKRLLAVPGVRAALFRDHTVTIEREPGTAWDALDRAVDAAIRDHFLGCGVEIPDVPVVVRDDAFEAEVERVLREQIAPGVQKDGGDIQLVEVRDGVARVSLVGACTSCPASTTTLKLGVETTLKMAFPGRITAVEAVG